MDRVLKLCFNIFCINFCASTTIRSWLLLFHVLITFATLKVVLRNRELDLYIPKNLTKNHTVAVYIWIFCYIGVYTVIFIEGFVKDSKLNIIYNSLLIQSKFNQSYYRILFCSLIFLDTFFLIITLLSDSYYQILHNSCLIPKLAIRFRLWGYLKLFEGVLKMLKEITLTLESAPISTIKISKCQEQYLQVWKLSQKIGNNYILSLLSLLFHVFFDEVVYIFWSITVDFVDTSKLGCKYIYVLTGWNRYYKINFYC